MADQHEAVRRRLTTTQPGTFCWHDHVAWCGGDVGDLERLAVAAFSAAVDRGDLMFFVDRDPDPQRLASLENLDQLVDRGTLQLITLDVAYQKSSDLVAQRAFFDALVDRALSDGFAGLCVVADNTSMASGTDDEFAAWLAWEATADHLQATRPINGVCYFDRRQLSSDRLADLAAMHPVLSSGFDPPPFQLYAEIDRRRVVGELDAWDAEQLHRIVTSAPHLLEPALDLSDVEFVGHRALLLLNEIGHDLDTTIRLRGAKPIVLRMWDLLEVGTPRLEFC